MRLFVLGPAFGLPSLDAECVAAVALLRLSLRAGEWSLVATHDQRKRLPCLIDGDETLEGYTNIARYVRRKNGSSGEATAVESFIQSQAPILLDISLYVAFENYTTTRSAFTRVLPWHANYIIPPARRAAARMRTQHLGIASIDVDDVHDDLSNRPAGMDVGKEPVFEAKSQQRASILLGGRKTVQSLLRRPEHAATFKLHALAQNFFDPLQNMLGESQFFLNSQSPSEIDCLVYAYLALMFYPQMPQDWLSKTLRDKFPALVSFTERMHKTLGMHTDVDEVMHLKVGPSSAQSSHYHDGMQLPWEASASSSATAVAATIARDLLHRISHSAVGTTAVVLIPTGPEQTTLGLRVLPYIFTTAIVAFGAIEYYAQISRSLFWPSGDGVHVFGRKQLSDYGHLGAALAGVSLLSRQATGEAAYHRQQTDEPVKVEVQLDQ